MKMAKKRKSAAKGQDSSGVTKMNIGDAKKPAMKKSLKPDR